MEQFRNIIIPLDGIAQHYLSYFTWNGRLILNIGIGNNINAGIKTTVPDNYNVLWIRVLNDRDANFNVTYLDGSFENMGVFNCGLGIPMKFPLMEHMFIIYSIK
jgi:hypothetical protein